MLCAAICSNVQLHARKNHEESGMGSGLSGIGTLYGKRSGAASGGAGERAGDESNHYDGEVAVAAIPEEHGRSGGTNAAGQVLVQSDTGERFVWTHGGA